MSPETSRKLAEQVLEKTLEGYSSVQPPGDFEQKLLLRLCQRPPQHVHDAQPPGGFGAGWRWWLAAAATMALLIGAGVAFRAGRHGQSQRQEAARSMTQPPPQTMAADRAVPALPHEASRSLPAPRPARKQIRHKKMYSAVFPTPFFPRGLAEALPRSGGRGQDRLPSRKPGAETRPSNGEIKPLVIEPIQIPPLALSTSNPQPTFDEENNP